MRRKAMVCPGRVVVDAFEGDVEVRQRPSAMPAFRFALQNSTTPTL
jgi:hypothetical protein